LPSGSVWGVLYDSQQRTPDGPAGTAWMGLSQRLQACGFAATAEAPAEWDTIDEDMAKIVETRQQAIDRLSPTVVTGSAWTWMISAVLKPAPPVHLIRRLAVGFGTRPTARPARPGRSRDYAVSGPHLTLHQSGRLTYQPRFCTVGGPHP